MEKEYVVVDMVDLHWNAQFSKNNFSAYSEYGARRFEVNELKNVIENSENVMMFAHVVGNSRELKVATITPKNIDKLDLITAKFEKLVEEKAKTKMLISGYNVLVEPVDIAPIKMRLKDFKKVMGLETEPAK